MAKKRKSKAEIGQIGSSEPDRDIKKGSAGRNHKILAHEQSGLKNIIGELKAHNIMPTQDQGIFQGLFNSMIDAVALHEIILDDKGRPIDSCFLEVNRAAEKILGRSKYELVGKTVREIAPHTTDEWIKKCGQVALSGKSAQFEYESTDFKITYNATVFSPMKGQFAIISHDITERKKIEENLKKKTFELNARIKELNCLHGISGLLYQTDQEYDELFPKIILMIITAFQFPNKISIRIRLNGWESESDSFNESVWKLMSIIRSGKSQIGKIEVTYNGEWQSINKGPFLKEEKSLIDTIALQLGQHFEQRKAEETHREEEIKFRSAFDNSSIGRSLTGIDGRLLMVNRAFCNLVGYSEKELTAGNFNAITHPDDISLGIECIRCLLAGEKETYQFDKRYIHKDSHIIFVSINSILIRDDKGNPLYINTDIIDITDRKRAEEDRRASEEQFHSLFTNMVAGFVLYEVVLDKSGNVCDLITLDINPAYEKMVGLKRNEVIGKRILGAFPWFPPKMLDDFDLVYKSGKSVRAERFHKEIGKHFETFTYPTSPGKIAVNFIDITDRKRGQSAIEDLARFPEENPGPVMRISHDNLILYSNPASAPVLMEWQTKQGAKLPNYIFDKVMEARSSDQSRDFEIRCGDRVYWFLINRVSSDKPTSMYGIDVTRRKKAEEALRLANAYNRSLIEASLDPLVTIGPDGKITDVNEATEKVTGLKRGELVDTDFSNYFTEPEKARAGYRKVFDEGFVRDYALEIRHRNGNLTPVLYHASLYRDEAGEVIGVFAAARDITESKKSEEALRESEERYRAMFENVNTAAALFEPIMDENGQLIDLRYLAVNSMLESVVGKRREYLKGQLYSQIFQLSERNPIFDIYEKVSTSGEPFKGELYSPALKGFYDMAIYRPSRGQLAVFFSDISERRKAEKALWKANELLETMFSNVNTHIVYLDKDFNFIRVNRAYAESCHYPVDFFPGEKYFILYPHAENEAIFREVVRTGKPYSAYAKPFVFPDQPERGVTYWNWTLHPVFEPDGTVGGLVFSLIDVSQMELIRQEIARRNEELRAVNNELQQFAYIASHDLQEPLRMIASYLQLIERRYTDLLDADGHDFINFAVEGATRLQKMIDSLLQYSRIETRGAIMQPIQTESALSAALHNLELVIEENNASIISELLPMVMADSHQLVQLFQNLIGNAIKFRKSEVPKIVISAQPDGDFWRFSVSDNGVGMDSKYFDRIFLIFQRLHGREYPGTGIGLALCKRIVERHGGKIWPESEVGRGTTFFFTLPAIKTR
jgi:PAS domain S-box-containing protein